MSDFVANYIKKYQNVPCSCGKCHTTPIHDVVIGKGVLRQLPEIIGRYSAKKVFLLADINTYAAAGKKVCGILEEAGIAYTKYIYQEKDLEPDERTVGSGVMHFDHSCEIVVAVGSGVINDTAKIISQIAGRPYIIVATAPSMDGYASDSSSMAMDGLKISLPSGAANVIVGDIDIIKEAPLPMLKAGLGDMLAKYISICEWKIAHLLIGEYYCETVASLVQTALKTCVDNAEGLLKRDEQAVQAVFEGLVISGIAMNYAKISRPASGMEHYISHVWDMRGLSMGTPVESHGVQCAIGTLYTARLYEMLREVIPDREKALRYVEGFEVEKWYQELRTFMGSGADAMIALDKKEQKYDKAKHAARLERILQNWETIQSIISGLPSAARIEAILNQIACPKSETEFGLSHDILPMTVKAAKDIRDKYVVARLLWDLGLLDEFAEKL
ncbi:MAG: sn-glycerol-1-phosphate dehydrogenase [Clostridia bacterium]|nr:sn-glycerol-1-phosphate dehydrogenase [Clostridia bacterium]